MPKTIEPQAGIHVAPDNITLRTSDGAGATVTMAECLNNPTDALLFAMFMKLTEISQLQRGMLDVMQAAINMGKEAQAGPNTADELLAKISTAMEGMPNLPPEMANLLGVLRTSVQQQ